MNDLNITQCILINQKTVAISFFLMATVFLFSISHAQTQDDVRAALKANFLRQKDKIIGAELILSDSYNGSVGSQFGHSAIRFVKNDSNPLSDYIIGFEAAVDDTPPEKQLYKGISGAFPMVMAFKTMRTFLSENTLMFDRSFRRVPLWLSQRQLNALISQVEQNLRNKNYRFFSNNCAHGLARFIWLAGIPLAKKVSIPNQLEKTARLSQLTFLPAIQVRNGYHVLKDMRKKAVQLGKFQLFESIEKAPSDDEVLLTMMEDWDGKDLAILIRSNGKKFKPETWKKFRSFYEEKIDATQLEYPLKIAALPTAFYGAQGFSKDLNFKELTKIFPEQELKNQLQESANIEKSLIKANVYIYPTQTYKAVLKSAEESSFTLIRNFLLSGATVK